MKLPEGTAEELAGRLPYPRAFLTVSGAHLYGFPSVDSDIDLRGVHLLPLEELVGLSPGQETITSTWDRSGVEMDVVTHDLAKSCRMLLNRNGYVLEQVMSPAPPRLTVHDLRGRADAVGGKCVAAAAGAGHAGTRPGGKEPRDGP